MKLDEWMEAEQLSDSDVVFLTRTIDPDAQGVSERSVWTARNGDGCKTLRIAVLIREASMGQVPLETFVDGSWLDEVRRRAAERQRR
jgi:hypothetical protein